ncbi:hypothetical protein [Pseudanabaena sp. 'Roaring Creek']|uniref:hypothetical protein n=1 Tax=Pseudanabaena sp. 'Roaring Creek' TaxID=1681830 RepID=UPI0006D820D2|nr:hypothetical protein [Pseudanabaena sp. 'Roaring Creek']
MILPPSTSSRAELLTALLLELIEILRDRQGDTWSAIVRIANGKSATIAIDDTRIFVQAEGEMDLQLAISEADPNATNAFESTGRALYNIIIGKSTLEKSVASGKIFISANFGDLLKIRAIVTAVLLDTSVEPRLLSLWHRFEQEWLK